MQDKGIDPAGRAARPISGAPLCLPGSAVPPHRLPAERPLFFGAEGAAKQQKKRKRSVFSATAPAACGSAPRRFSGRKARQNSRIGANVPFFRNGACGVRRRARAPAGAPRRFLMPPGFFIIMLKGAEGGKNVRGRQIFPFPPERKKFFKKSGKTESKTA